MASSNKWASTRSSVHGSRPVSGHKSGACRERASDPGHWVSLSCLDWRFLSDFLVLNIQVTGYFSWIFLDQSLGGLFIVYGMFVYSKNLHNAKRDLL